MKLDKIKMLLEYGNLEFSDNCIDCGNPTTVNIDLLDPEKSEALLNVSGGAIYEPPEQYGYNTILVIKCMDCYNKDTLCHQKNEIYSRCVGYIRPVLQWNRGKRAEFKSRLMFDMATTPELVMPPKEGATTNNRGQAVTLDRGQAVTMDVGEAGYESIETQADSGESGCDCTKHTL